MFRQKKIGERLPLSTGVGEGSHRLKKIIISVLISAIVVTLLICPFSVSAVIIDGLNITGIGGYIWRPGTSTSDIISATIQNLDNRIVFNYSLDSWSGVVQTEATLYTVGSVYGTLELSYQSAFGETSPVSSFEGLYDGDNGGKLAEFSVGNSYYYCKYTGKIPSKLIIRGYFTCDVDDVLQSYTVLNINFIDLEDEYLINIQNENTDKIINNQNQNSQEIQNNQDKNTDKIINNQNQNSQEIQNNQDKNTDKIINNQNQLQENEKNEANSSGNAAMDGVSSAVPDYSGNLLSAFNNLTSNMVHSNVQCEIEIPAIKIPELKIPILNTTINDITLMESKKINLFDYLGLIPYTILSIVKIVLTCALIIFAFKEFYGLFELIFTLKGSAKE